MESLAVDVSEHVATVALLGPGKGNALGPDFWRECPGVFEELDANEDVRAIVLHGQGEHFCYGLDLKAMIADLGPHMSPNGLAKERTKLLDLVARLQRAADAIAVCRKPTIAAISGYCIGGGVDLVSACDIRLASQDAKLSVRETRVAMVADLGSLQRLPRIVGKGLARELAFTGDDVGADRALRIGLVNEVFADRAALLEGARALALRIAKNPPLVVQGVKQVMEYCEDKSVKDGERFVAVWNAAFLASGDLSEALSAFAERREPRFRGE